VYEQVTLTSAVQRDSKIVYRVIQNKMPQHKNYYSCVVQEYFAQFFVVFIAHNAS